MTFWLKKIVTLGIMPLTVAVFAAAVGLILTRSDRWRRRGKWLIALSILGVAFLGNHFVARSLMRPLETRYAALPEATSVPAPIRSCEFVVVLGAGSGVSPASSSLGQLNFAGLARISEGVRIARLLPAAKLVVSGPLVADGITHASQLKRAAISLGIPADRILTIETGLDTENEARLAARIVGQKPVALVTSAAHMPRALGLFRATGIAAYPCPTGFRTQAHEDFMVEHLFFDVESLAISTNAIRERIGMLWNGLRGKSAQ